MAARQISKYRVLHPSAFFPEILARVFALLTPAAIDAAIVQSRSLPGSSKMQLCNLSMSWKERSQRYCDVAANLEKPKRSQYDVTM
jgi:hypothetical protein